MPSPTEEPATPTAHLSHCPVCSAPTEGTAWQRYRVCGACRYHFQLTATERLELLADAESFKASNPSLVSVDPLVFTDRVSYRDRLERARRETGLNEAVVTGTANGGEPQQALNRVMFSMKRDDGSWKVDNITSY